jgi:hypothetical protein
MRSSVLRRMQDPCCCCSVVVIVVVVVVVAAQFLGATGGVRFSLNQKPVHNDSIAHPLGWPDCETRTIMAIVNAQSPGCELLARIYQRHGDKTVSNRKCTPSENE